MVLELLAIAIAIVFSFDFFNGFHDAANAIATVVATKVLTPVKAVGLAAVGNFVGMVFITNAIAETIGKGIIDTRVLGVGATTLLAGLIAGLLPSVFLGRILLRGLVQIVVYMVAAPLVGLIAAFGLALLLIRLFRKSTPSRVNHEFRRLQLVSSFFYSVTHGTNDAQKGMGIITLLLIVFAIGPPL